MLLRRRPCMLPRQLSRFLAILPINLWVCGPGNERKYGAKARKKLLRLWGIETETETETEIEIETEVCSSSSRTSQLHIYFPVRLQSSLGSRGSLSTARGNYKIQVAVCSETDEALAVYTTHHRLIPYCKVEVLCIQRRWNSPEIPLRLAGGTPLKWPQCSFVKGLLSCCWVCFFVLFFGRYYACPSISFSFFLSVFYHS